MSKEEYIERTTEIMQGLDVEMLKKVYTMAKTLLSISQERKGGAADGKVRSRNKKAYRRNIGITLHSSW